MFEKIMVPLDGSQLAEVALPYAEEMAGKLGSDIVIVHVRDYESCQMDDSVKTYMQQIIERTAYDAEKHIGKLVAKKINVSQQVLNGNPAEELVDYSNRENISLILLATHGRTGISRWALGSVANRIVRYSYQPVILVRAKADHSLVHEQDVWRKILIPIDNSWKSDILLPYVESLAHKLKTTLILFHVIESTYHVYGSSVWITDIPYTDREINPVVSRAEAKLQDITEKLSARGIVIDHIVKVGNPAKEIIKYAREQDVNLVAMTTHARSGIHRWVLGSVADKVLHSGDSPLMVVKFKRPEYARNQAIINANQASAT